MNKNKIILIGSVIATLILVIFILLFINQNKEVPTYKVVFDSDGGTQIEVQNIKQGDSAKKPTDPTKEGYAFVDWAYNNATYDFKSKVTKDITLVARWFKVDEDIETFTIKFNSDGGTTISNQIVEKGKTIAKPIDPVKDGYKFNGWMLNGEVYDFSKTVESNIELIAVWEKVKQDVSTTKTTKTTTTKQVAKPAETTKPVTTTKKEETTTKPVETTTKPKQKYTVTFNSNGGSAVSTQTITEGSKVTKPSNPTRSGYNFVAWTLNGSNYDFNSSVNSNITLVAKWQQKSYIVKVSSVDQYSPDRILTVYEDGTKISVSSIKYNGVTLCSGSNMVVNMYEISGISSVTVVLTSGSSVTASVQ